MLVGLELENVDNTSDASKPISTLTQTALNLKADASALTSGLAGKAATSHTHAQSEITGLVAGLLAKLASDHTQAANGTAATFLSFNNIVFMDQTNAAIIDGNEDPETVYFTVEDV
jgi:hypothetical protein